eukprot:4627160-Pleurochrysis_carterae.AAC.1
MQERAEILAEPLDSEAGAERAHTKLWRELSRKLSDECVVVRADARAQRRTASRRQIEDTSFPKSSICPNRHSRILGLGSLGRRLRT